MHPELFEIPFLHQTVKSWGVMVVIGFLAAMWVMRRMIRRVGENPDWVSNAALYALIAGVIGARIFYVVHHFDQFRGRLLSTLAIWEGGVEFRGGVLAALAVLCIYLITQKRSLLLYFDILAVGLMVGLGFGRIGCFFSGCCYGKQTTAPCGIRFPYDSTVYNSQIRPNPNRDRQQPHLDLPAEFYGMPSPDGSTWLPLDESNKQLGYLKPFDQLTPQQQQQVTKGPYRCRKVHPTQFYASANAFLLAVILYGLWRRFGPLRPGAVSGIMLILYGITRFGLEILRDDNPFEYEWWMLYQGGTISQNMGIYLVFFGIVLAGSCLWKSKPLIIEKRNNDKTGSNHSKKPPKKRK